MIDRFTNFLLLAVVNNSFMLRQPFMMMLVVFETTFMFSLHLSNFFVLSLYMNSFLPLVMLERFFIEPYSNDDLSHVRMMILVVFEQLSIFLAMFQ